MLRDIAGRLVQDNNTSDMSYWRTRQYARTEQLNKRTSSLVSSYSEAQTGHMRSAIETAMLQEIGYVDSAVQSAVSKGLFSGTVKTPAKTLVNNTAAEFEDRIQNDLNVVNRVMRNKARDAYMMGVNDMYNQIIANGELSLQEASRKTIKRLAQKGIPGYIDKRGGEWTPDSYMNRSMKAALGSATRAAQNARCDEYGIKLIQVSSHMGARPLCAPYQGRIFSRDGSSGVTTDGAGGKIEYTPLSETSYGDPAGLFGVNCGHVQLPFIPGVDMQRFFPYPKDENDEYYQKLQKQRYIERQIKATKRECMMFDATGDKEEFARSSLKLRNQQEQYANYCKAVGLSRNDERTQVYGFDRSVSSKSTWAVKKSASAGLTNLSNGDIIKPYEEKKTREQLKAIIRKARAQKRPIFAEDTADSPFATNVRRVAPKDDYYDVALHGTDIYAEFFGEKIDAYTLAKIIKSRDDYTPGKKVRLLSCSTGDITNTGDCFAQLLANELGVQVEAPTKTLWVYPNGEFTIGTTKYVNDGTMKTFYSRK